MRPQLDVDAVATGEHWYGSQAIEKGLIDEISTSDDVLLNRMQQFTAVNIRYIERKKMVQRLTGAAAESADRLLLRWWQRGEKPLL